MDNRIIVFFTNGKFPIGPASANRLVGLCKSLMSIGYETYVFCNGTDIKEEKVNLSSFSVYEGIKYMSFKNSNQFRLTQLYKRLNISMLIHKNFNKYERAKISYIAFTHKNFGILQLAQAKIMRKKTIVDVTEWHDRNQFKGLKQSINYYLHQWRVRFLITKAKKIITVSKYMEEYYTNKKKTTLRIPPQIDCGSPYSYTEKTSDKIVLLYAGNLSKKDYLDEFFLALSQLNEDLIKRVTFKIAGPSETELRGCVKNFDKIKVKLESSNSLEILGRVSKTKLEYIYLTSHFSILFRPAQRYSKAGFPSKVPESLAFGVPIIANSSSDLNLYLIDGENSILVETPKADAIKKTLERTLNQDIETYLNMSKLAFETAREHFHFANYNDMLRTFLDS